MKKLYDSIRLGQPITWKEIYKDEEELLRDFDKIDIVKYNYKGKDYIRSFKKQEKLSSKQITQLKRLSKWIKLYHMERI